MQNISFVSPICKMNHITIAAIVTESYHLNGLQLHSNNLKEQIHIKKNQGLPVVAETSIPFNYYVFAQFSPLNDQHQGTFWPIL